MSLEEIKQTFFLECEDLLSELEQGLNDLLSGDQEEDTLNAVFRAVHSIKGGAGAFNLEQPVEFSHTFENCLDDLRSGKLEPTQEIWSLCLSCSDTLQDLIWAARDGTTVSEERPKSLLAQLQKLNGSADPAPSDEVAEPEADDMFGFQPISFDFADTPESSSAGAFSIELDPTPKLFERGNSMVRLLRELGTLGEMTVSCDTSHVPKIEKLDDSASYLRWSVQLETEQDEDAIREVFDFVEDVMDIIITPIQTEVEAPIEPNPVIEETENLGARHAEHVDAPIAEQTLEPETPKSNKTSKLETKKKSGSVATIRINLERVDKLINQVGELVINQAMLSECVLEAGLGRNPSVLSGLNEFKQLTRDIQDSVMAIRAQPVQPLFQRMSRIVREAAEATGKKARLVMEGEHTEVDKTIIEKLSDPLTHMIRNAIDHGLESPEDRIAKGKDETGVITLSASHRSGKVVIEILDDGAGINRPKVRSIAESKGLISEDAVLVDSEIDNLLFMPGFSTVTTVSTLSGRGVGMDVVKRAINDIGGRIAISSEPDHGSRFSINLPLTLAVLDGMLVEVRGQTLVVPLTAIVETLPPNSSLKHSLGDNKRLVNVRGTYLPLIDLGQALSFDDSPVAPGEGVILSLEAEDGSQFAILVDSIQDQRQVVIKSLEDNYGKVHAIAAATILGDGRIALILDVDGLTTSQTSADPQIQLLNTTQSEAEYV